MFDWLAVYITLFIVYVRVYWTKTINMLYTPRQGAVTRLSKHRFIVEFYLGETKCKIAVARSTGPVPFYMATTADDSDEITADVVPFFAARPLHPTPAMLGHEFVTLWDIDDNGALFAEHEPLGVWD